MKSKRLLFALILILFNPKLSFCSFDTKNIEAWRNLWEEKLQSIEPKFPPSEVLIYISFRDRKLWHISLTSNVILEFDVLLGQTASNQTGSHGTPIGLHYIYSKIGEGEEIGMVFESRMPIGIFPKEAIGQRSSYPVTTRIMQLDGLQEDFNKQTLTELHLSSECENINKFITCDTLYRYIYIHGTPRPRPWNEQYSRGCISLSDEDIIKLFGLTPLGSLVLIEESLPCNIE